MAVFRFGEFRADTATRRLECQERLVALTAKQFDLLVALLERPGEPLSKQELRDRVWPDTFVEENNLTQHVFQLRKALASAGGDGAYIETLPKTGYQFVVPVTVEAEPEAVEPPASRRRFPVRWLVAAVLVMLAAGTLGFGKRQWDFWMESEPDPVKAPMTVAVAPFDAPLGAAFAAELAVTLGRLDNIHVQVVQPASILRKADFTLSGTLDGRTATAELRRGDELVWRHELSGEPAALNAEIAGYAAVSLEELAGARRRRLLSRKTPANNEAYLAYLEGAQRLTSRRGSPVEAFQKSLRADPGYPGAYVGMALYYTLAGINQAEEPRLVWQRAREFSQKALEMEPENGEARMIQAYVLAYADQDEREAERVVRAVLATDPGSVSLQLFAGQLLSRLGRFVEAEEILKSAIHGDPTLLLGRQILAHHYYLSRQYDLSKREAWRIIRMAPKSGTGYGLLVPPMWATGDWRLASMIAGRAEAAGLTQPFISMGLAYTYGRSGRLDDARRIVRAMDEQARMSHVSSLQRAVAHVGVGDNDEAVRLLRNCASNGCVNPSLLRLEPVFDVLRGHPGFHALVQ